MKKILFASLLMGASALMASAQTEFRHITFEQALEASQQENKPVFIDFYTTWCGPCKMMSNKVFPQQEVGDFMNKTFVSIKLDAEAEGQELAKKYEVKAYPTYVIVNAQGDKVASFSGAMEGEKFIDKVQSVIDPERSPKRIAERYNSGDRTPAVVNQYAMQFMEQRKEKEGFDVINDYWDSLTDAQRLQHDNTFLFTVYTIDLNDPKADFMKKHINDFDEADKGAVKGRMSQLLNSELRKYLSGFYWKEGKYTTENFEALKADLASLGLNEGGKNDLVYQFVELRPTVDDAAYLTFMLNNFNKLNKQDQELVTFNLERLFDCTNPETSAQIVKFIREQLPTMTPVAIQFAGRTLGNIEK